MAKKRVSSKKQDVNELDILFPERSATIAGRSIIVKEYSFVEGQRLLYLAEPLIRELTNLYIGDIPSYSDIQFLVAKHIDNIIKLVAASIDQPEEWICSLKASEGELLNNIWWAVNGNFYIRSAIMAAAQKKQGIQ